MKNVLILFLLKSEKHEHNDNNKYIIVNPAWIVSLYQSSFKIN